ncbi:hypothetical protein [Cellulomonas biazotea]|uniref:hypothetical protein n=3 Tax=Cellulomonas biazotea TaxID=1709 RepID=UPI0035ED3E9E
MSTDETRPTTPGDDDDTTLPQPADGDTQILPGGGDTQILATTRDDTLVLATTDDSTDDAATSDATRPLPATDAAPATWTAATPAAPAATPAPTPAPTAGAAAGGTGPVRTAPASTTATVVDDEPAVKDTAPRPRLRVGTVVWGLVLAAIGVGLLAWAAGLSIDVQLAIIVLLAVAGAALLVGSIVSATRSSRR